MEFRKKDAIWINLILLSVFEYGLRFHENLQSDLHDAADWPLERLPTVFSANVARFSIKLLGIDQRTAGIIIYS